VAKTIEGVRLRFPEGKVWAIFEPRSNTSRRKVFQGEFVDALARADRVIVASPFKGDSIPSAERFDSHRVAAALMKAGTDAHHIEDVEHMVEFAVRGAEPGDVILVMSNGDFEGLVPKLVAALQAKRQA
jgi:UDP-N-acetylmuramate: L-alanyl-gamma-D-glutamyl-meso-diaminopimelate ligase